MRAYQTAFASELPLANNDPVKAHTALMIKHPELAAQPGRKNPKPKSTI